MVGAAWFGLFLAAIASAARLKESLQRHFTHLGVCYPGNNATLQISSPDHPQPVKFTATSVPEPAIGALSALALILSFLFARIKPRGGTKLG